MRLADLPWTELVDRASSSLLAVPLGSTEQHGPHLPLSTDADVATALAEALAARRADVLVAPTLAYGASGEHADFPGTLSMGVAALELVLVELVRSADPFAGVILVDGHGGNHAAVTRAVARLEAEGRQVLALSPAIPGGDAHAGHSETSLMLALRPEVVRVEAAAPGDLRPLAELLPELQARGVASVSANGVLGDPAGATGLGGRRLLHRVVDEFLDSIARRWPVRS